MQRRQVILKSLLTNWGHSEITYPLGLLGWLALTTTKPIIAPTAVRFLASGATRIVSDAEGAHATTCRPERSALAGAVLRKGVHRQGEKPERTVATGDWRW